MFCVIQQNTLVKMEKLNFIKSIKPYIALAKIFGLFPSIIKNENSDSYFFVLSSPQICYSILVISIPIVLVVVSCLSSDKRFLLELWRIIAVCGCFLNCLQLIYQITKIKNISKFVIRFENFDKACQRSGIIINYKSERKNIAILSLSIFTIFFFLIFTITMIYIHDGAMQVFELHLSHCHQLVIGYFFTVQFCIFAMLFSKRFQKINEYLHRAVIVSTISENLENLKTFKYLHFKLTELVEDLNKIFTSNLSITLINALYNATLSMYIFIYATYRGLDGEHTNHTIVDGCWMCVNLTFLVIICKAGNSVKASAELTKQILIKAMVNARTESIERTLRHIHYQVKNSPTRIENFFVVVDWKLLLMVSCVS